MKLYQAKAPSALRTNMFIQEKGIDIDLVWIDLMGGESHKPPFLTKNSLGQVPVLELEDGFCLTESIAICRYLESLYPNNPLCGTTPLESAHIEMWTRRMENLICAPISQIGIHTFPFFADKVEQVPEYAQTQIQLQQVRWEWLNNHLSNGDSYVCENRFSLADIAGSLAIMVSDFAGQSIPEKLVHAKRWETAMRSKKGWFTP